MLENFFNELSEVQSWLNRNDGLATWAGAAVTAWVGVLALMGPRWAEQRKARERLVSYRHILFQAWDSLRKLRTIGEDTIPSIQARLATVEMVDLTFLPPEMASDLVVVRQSLQHSMVNPKTDAEAFVKGRSLGQAVYDLYKIVAALDRIIDLKRVRKDLRLPPEDHMLHDFYPSELY